jgi:localization factor PodJL
MGGPPFQPRLGTITTESLDSLRRRARAGDTDAMEELARRYVEGAGVRPNPVEGASWLRLAAERGAPGAMFNVGVMYERGMVLERDPAKAMEWYGRAASAGVAMATHNMALMYREGTGVPVDHKRAFDMLLSAARLGMSASMFVLGTMYEAGSHGLPRDQVQAIVWYAMSMQFQRAHPAMQASDLAVRAEQKTTDLQGRLSQAELQRAQAMGEREYRVIIAMIRAASRARPATPPASAPPPPAAAAPAAGPPSATAGDAPPAPVEPPPPPPPTASAPPPPAPPEATPPAPPAEAPASARDQLMEIQKLLAALRLYGGKIDGMIGPQTRKAIRDYQRANGMPQTGEPSPKLAEALRKQAEKAGRR